MKRRRKLRSCTLELRAGRLPRLRFRWHGKRYTWTLKAFAAREDRQRAEELATLIGAAIAADRDPFDLLQPARPSRAIKTASTTTVAEFYRGWIIDTVPPLVRKAQARDYRRHIEGYVLPALGEVPIAELTARDILGLRVELLKRNLSVKYVKNIIACSFRALVRDARTVDAVIQHDPFLGIRWPTVAVPGPDPLSAGQRSRVLQWFRQRRFGHYNTPVTSGPRLRPHPAFHAYVLLLVSSGMRPSEASGLTWGDVDLDAGIVRVTRSLHRAEYSSPKTSSAARTVELTRETVRVLRTIQPLHLSPDTPVFTNVDRCVRQDSSTANSADKSSTSSPDSAVIGQPAPEVATVGHASPRN